MHSARVLVALGALQLRCLELAHPSPIPPPPRRPTPVVVAPPPPDPAAAWSEGFHLHHGVADFAPSYDVLVHAPARFDASAPLHLVIVLHGMGHSALQWAGAGVVDPRTGRAAVSWGGAERHDLAATRTLLVIPQFDDRRGHARLGRLGEPGGLRRFLDELLGESLAPRLGGPRSLADVAGVTLVGSSAGGPSIAELLDLDDLDGRVRGVVLFDSIYRGEASHARWLLRDPSHRLACIHEGLAFTAPGAARLLALVRPALRAQAVVQPAGSITEALRTHRAVFATVPCEHIGMGPAYLDKVLLGLGLPTREPDPDGKVPEVAAAAPTHVLARGESFRGAVVAGDPVMRDGSAYQDHAIDLREGETVTITLAGGPSPGVACRVLDVQLRVLDGERVLADDDDSGGGFDSLVRVTAPRAGRYTVRVMTHGPWLNVGDYTLRVGR